MVLSIWFLSLEEAISDICMCGPKKTFHLIPRVGESSVKLKCWRAPSELHAAEAGGPLTLLQLGGSFRVESSPRCALQHQVCSSDWQHQNRSERC